MKQSRTRELRDSPDGPVVKNLPCNAGYTGSVLDRETMWYSHKINKYKLCVWWGGGGCTQSCLTLMIPWTIAHQALLYMGFPRQEYWSELPFPYPRALPHPGIGPKSLALASRFFTIETPGKPAYAW